MKNYFNSREREQFLTFLKSMVHAEHIEDEWGPRGNLTKDELKSLRMVQSWTRRFIESVLNRQNADSKKSIAHAIKTSTVVLDYKDSASRLLKKRCTDINAGYEENKDFIKLVELILHYNCRNCTCRCEKCEIYSEFEKLNVPEFQDYPDNGKCKYSYNTQGGN